MSTNEGNPYGLPRRCGALTRRDQVRNCLFIPLISIAVWSLVGLGAALAGLVHAQYTIALAFTGGVIGVFLTPIAYIIMYNRPIWRCGLVLLGFVPTFSTAAAFIWPASILATPLIGFVLAGAFINIKIPRAEIQIVSNRCDYCDYSLDGLPTKFCPECGANQSESTPN